MSGLPKEQRPVVPIKQVRAWAKEQGLDVGVRGHVPQGLVDQFNRKHRKVQAVNTNPRKGK